MFYSLVCKTYQHHMLISTAIIHSVNVKVLDTLGVYILNKNLVKKNWVVCKGISDKLAVGSLQISILLILVFHNRLHGYFDPFSSVYCCKFRHFREGFIFAKLHENKILAKLRNHSAVYWCR